MAPYRQYRQWVFTVPKPLRLVLARDPAWTRWTGTLVVRAIAAWQRRVARKRGLPAPRTRAVTFVQRFGGLVNLNVRFDERLHVRAYFEAIADDGRDRTDAIDPRFTRSKLDEGLR